MNAEALQTPPKSCAQARVNIAHWIPERAQSQAEQTAIITAGGDSIGFRDLNARIDRIAHGLNDYGIKRGARVVLAARPGIDFFALTFALFKIGAVPVMVDPGMGRSNMLACIAEAEPEALIGIPLAHLLSRLYPGAFKTVTRRVTIGRRWLWGGRTLRDIERGGEFDCADTAADETAAILFTSGATGVPKGVVYEHGMFDGQVRAIRDAYGIEPGEVDVSCFPLFALFSLAMGCTVALPEMDPTRPAGCDPEKLVGTINRRKATMAFGSPAVWRRVGPWLRKHDQRMPTVKRILIAGAPVPVSTLEMFNGRLADDGDLHTAYGATESLPVGSVGAREILGETAAATREGAGTCVGAPVPGVDVRIVRVVNGPLQEVADAEEMPAGEVGEVLVRSAVTTREYFNRPEATALAKVRDGNSFWHRMGDTGYLDDRGRIWFCGRVAHRVETRKGALYPVRCEGIFNTHPAVARSALVGVDGEPVIVIELTGQSPPREEIKTELLEMAARHEMSKEVRRVLFHEGFPVDVRHNAKIDRLKLAAWAKEPL